jgi:hypothetical protein
MTKTVTPTTALETTFITEEQTATLVSKVELALEQLDEVAGGDCSCVNCCSHSAKATSLRAVSLPALNIRARF